MSDQLKIKSSSTVDKNNAIFSTNFYKTVIEDRNGNFICSPISASIALAMTAFGAKNNTEKEMCSALHLSDDVEVNKLGYQNLIDKFNAVKYVQLNIANKIFVANNIEVHCSYKSVTRNYFRSELQLVNFRDGPAALKIINDWCQNKTDNRIKNILDEIDPSTRLVIVNAIYFKGKWKNKFDNEYTKLKPFNIDDKTHKNVLMMHKKGLFNCGTSEYLGAQFLELPYESNSVDDAMSMFIIFPNNHDGLKKIEENLNNINFQQLHESGYLQELIVELPKFTIQNRIDLVNPLKKMGMINMFDIDKADFSGISNEPLYVGKIIHEAFIEVNEEGSEAAAATATILIGCSSPQSTPKIVIDRPFFCAIVATKTGTQFFNARVVDPSDGPS